MIIEAMISVIEKCYDSSILTEGQNVKSCDIYEKVRLV